MFKLKNPLAAVAVRYGLLGALLAIVALLVMYYFVRHPLAILVVNQWLDIRFPLYLLLIFAGLKEFKDYFGGGLHFWQGLAIGVGIYMIAALGAAVFIYIFSAIEATGFLASYIEQTRGYLLTNEAEYVAQLGQERFDTAVQSLDGVSALSLTSQYLLQSTLIGLFLTIIMSVIMRKKV